MLFNSLEFLYIFLPLTLGIFYLFARFRLIKLSKGTLLATSFAFYAYWKLSYFALIVFKIITNYFLAIYLNKNKTKLALWIGVIFNLGILVYFKYLNFFIEIFNHVIPLIPGTVSVTIPLGISFYTFTQLTYLEDLYRGKARFHGLQPYSLFVIFFPHLIAGPIVHYSQVMPQFSRLRTYVFQYKNFFTGVFLFLAGLFQKVVIADSVSHLADMGFANASLLTFFEAWSSVLSYSMQIYFDFAGYSNMAIGLALLFNIRFPENFNSPYQAESVIDFWRRWHMTLSQFLRDYLYIRFGGNRFGLIRKYINILLTMLIGGLWHGANWTFILWGAYHGILLVINHIADEIKLKLPRILGRLITFAFVVYGWVFFRSANLNQIVDMSRALAGGHGFGLRNTYFLWKDQFLFLVIALGIA